MPVSMWSTDGIHPGPAVHSASFRKYRRNMKRCLLAASAEFTAILSKVSRRLVKYFGLGLVHFDYAEPFIVLTTKIVT